MANVNPLRRYLQTKHPSPETGQGGSVLHRYLDGVSGDQLEALVRAEEAAGHLEIVGRPIGGFRYALTADGAHFLGRPS